MIAFPAGVRVWIAGGVTDMRRGMNTLALQAQEGLGRDPHAGEILRIPEHPPTHSDNMRPPVPGYGRPVTRCREAACFGYQV
jgi:hypothetical protein